MGLLDKLWDDSLAGPCPDSGLAKLRKITITNSSVAPASTPVAEEALSRLRKCRVSAECQRSNDEARHVTQIITIIKPPGYLRSLSLDSPSSPAGSSPPISPCSPTPRERENPWRRNKHEKVSERSPRAEPRSPTVYDWVVFSALHGWQWIIWWALHAHYFLSAG